MLRCGGGQAVVDVGETFLAAGHLWVAVAKSAAGEIAAFNLTTFKPGSPGCDSACVVEPGEHPFIKHKSCVHYAGGALLSVDEQAGMAARKSSFPPHARASDGLLAKIRAGALASDQTSQKLQHVIRPPKDPAA
jgi:hypothetical protein